MAKFILIDLNEGSYGINLAWSGIVAHLKRLPRQAGFYDQALLRIKSPSGLLSSAGSRENHYGYLSGLFASRWPFLTRVAVFSLGLLGFAVSFRTRGIFRRSLRVFGVASWIRAITNLQVTDLIGWLANPTVRLRRTLRIHAPIEDVYDFLSQFTNFPQFMSFVQEVELTEQGVLHWTARGPVGLKLHWNTTLGKMIRNQSISWKSTGQSLIRNSGDFQLIDLSGEGTEMHIELTYSPPAGAIGYFLLHLLGFDPKDKIDHDLQVLKTLVEQRSPPTEELVNFRRARA